MFNLPPHHAKYLTAGFTEADVQNNREVWNIIADAWEEAGDTAKAADCRMLAVGDDPTYRRFTMQMLHNIAAHYRVPSAILTNASS